MAMSTQSKQTQYRTTTVDVAPQASDAPPQTPAKGRRKWPWLAGGVVIVLVWLLPGVIAHTPLLGWGISMATADLQGSVSVRSVSLGWFSPIVADGIEVRDAKGQTLLQAASLKGDKSLLSMLGNLSALGKLKLDKPKLNIDVRADGSNLEDALAKYLAPSDKPKSRVGVELEIVDGTVALNDQVNRRTWSIEKLQFSLAMSADPTKPLEIKTSATVSDLQRAANFDLALLLEADMSGQCTLNSDGLPLAMCDAFLKRAMPNSAIGGRLMAQLKGQWSASGRTDVQGQLSTTGFEFTAPSLGTDRLAFDRFQLTCRAAGQNNVYIIDPSTLDCDLGKLTVSGNLDLSRRATMNWLDAILAQDYEVKGSLDLARLAAMLPKTLRVREGTQITSGQAEVQLTSRKAAQGMIWHAGIDTANLRAATQKGEFAWPKPIVVTVDAHQVPQGIVIDDLKCEADFLSIEAKGTPDDLTATASFNLKTLDEQLGKFVAILDELSLAGDGWGRLTWKHAADSRFDAKMELKVGKFQCCLPGKAPWTENDLMAIAGVKGKADPLSFTSTARIDEATVSIRTVTDKIDVELTQPVVNVAADKWPLHVEMSGQIEPWIARLGVWVSLDGWRATGAYEVNAVCQGSSQGVDMREARVLIAPLQVASSSIAINEPRVDITAAGAWNRAKGSFTLEPFSLVSNTVAIEGKKVVFSMPAEGRADLSGSVGYKADLARLVQWFVDPAKPREWNVTGALAGTLGFQSATFGTDGVLDAEIANLSVVTAGGKPATEPRVKVTAKGNYNHNSGLIDVAKAEIVSQAIAAGFAGRVEGKEQRNISLQGNIGCDWTALCGLLRPFIGPKVEIVGRSSAPASLEGPIDLTAARGATALQWQSANIYGFPLGAAQANIKLSEGFARVEPCTLVVSQGRVTLAPAVRVSDPYELFLPPGKLVERVQITRPMCDAALMYIAPVLADVADAKGSFSIELDSCRIPLTDPAKGDIGGRFIVHDVEVGASPLVQAFVSLFGRISPGKLRREAIVPFRMVAGRVYHQDLELIFPEVTIRTHGSVGIDQTMQILAEIPVPQKWIDAMGKTALADSMRGQTISIPVGGTLTKPQLDPRVVDQLSKQFVRSAAENVLEGEINKGLDRLFGPRK